MSVLMSERKRELLDNLKGILDNDELTDDQRESLFTAIGFLEKYYD